MKKIFSIIVLATIIVSVAACGGNANGRPKGDLDTLSYAVGVKYGMSIGVQLKDLNLNKEQIKTGINDFLASGDINDDKFRENGQRLMQFMYINVNSYMRAKQERDAVITDQPDTLPALPELWTEEFTCDDMSYIIGQDMGASIKMSEPQVDQAWMMYGFDDAASVTSAETIDTELEATMAQLEAAYMAGIQAERERKMAEREKLGEENAAACAEWLAEIEKQEGVQKTESGILYRIDREGTGAQATQDEDVVLVNYEGKTRSGEIFDSSYERGEAISFPLNRVIKGWTEGMKLVKVGGQITLWIPAELAYGANGSGEKIGPNEALEFKVELLELNPEE